MTFTACYDLQCNPPTYDVVAFLAILELERIRQEQDDIELHILPGHAGGFRKDNLWPYNLEERVRLRDDLLVPLCQLLPSVSSVTIEVDRSESGWGREARHISLMKIMEALRYGSRPLRPMFPSILLVDPATGTKELASGPVIRDPNLITFTLREAEHHPLRNSRTAEWLEAAERLRDSAYDVVIVPDTARLPEQPDLHDRGVKAASSLLDRAELYASAALNVGICNGPIWMALFMDAPTLMLRPVTNAARACYDERFYAKFGLKKGDQLPTSPAYQRLVWEEDYCSNIVGAVRSMLGGSRDV